MIEVFIYKRLFQVLSHHIFLKADALFLVMICSLVLPHHGWAPRHYLTTHPHKAQWATTQVVFCSYLENGCETMS